MEPFCDDSDLRSGIPDLASDCCVGHRGADEVSANSIYGRSGSWWIVPELASFAVAVSAATESASELADTRCDFDSISPCPGVRGQPQD